MWLEARGFGGLDMLMDAMNARHELSAFSGAISEGCDDTVCEIDFKGGSLLLGLHMCTDLAIDMAAKTGHASLIIKNARHNAAIIAATASCARFDYSSEAVWNEGYAKCAAGEVAPAVFGGLHDRVELRVSQTIEASTRDIKLSGSDVQERYDMALQNCISVDVDIYKTLGLVADRILVEATEASRQGAGE